MIDEVFATQKKQVMVVFILNWPFIFSESVKKILVLQVETKIEAARKEREQLLQDREEIVESMEVYNSQMKRVEMEEKQKKLKTKEDLLAQIENKNKTIQDRQLQEQRNVLRQEQLQAAFDEKHWAIEMDRLKL